MRRRALLRAIAAASATAIAGCVGQQTTPGGDDGTETTTSATTKTTTTSTASTTIEPTTTETTQASTAETTTSTRTTETTTSTRTTETTTSTRTPETTTTKRTTTDPSYEPPLAPGVDVRTITSEGSCLSDPGSVGDHDVTQQDDRAVISGSFRTSVPCYLVRVVETSREDGTYRVLLTVERKTEGGDPTVCVQCVGRVDYELTVEFSDPPDRIDVEHVDGSQ